jgi:hypothetical protein
MNNTKIVRENVLLALAYWIIGLIGNYWIRGVFLIILFSPVHCLVLLILAITMPQKRPYWLAFMGVCLLAGSGIVVFMYLVFDKEI